MITRIFLLLVLSSILFCCTNTQPDNRLTEVADLVNKNPQKALDSIYSIPYSELSDADKHLFDFLLVKCSDKAFVTHTSDSLILKVINYESKNRHLGRYAEALYYGGRVYHDLGDMPTALSYYQNALDLVSTESMNNSIRDNILSQISGVLNSLRLYEQAIPYVTEVIKSDSLSNDSMNLMYDTELLGSINLHAKKFDSAESAFKKAIKIAKRVSPDDSIRQCMYLAATKYNKNQIDSALTLIRPTLKNIDSISRNVALAYAGYIYKKAGIADTAIMYASELIKSKDSLNRHTGYHIILSKEFKGHIHPDSAQKYIYDYSVIINSLLNKNGNNEALMQNSFYNYQLHQRERIKTEEYNNKLQIGIIIFLLITGILSISLLYMKNKDNSQRLNLIYALDKLQILSSDLQNASAEKGFGNKCIYLPKLSISNDLNSNTHSISHKDNNFSIISGDIPDLRIKLRNELLSIRNNYKPSPISSVILESEIYNKIQSYIKNGKVISDKNPIWAELEEIILQVSPNFKQRLNLLTVGKLKPSDIHTALLIKCGISPTNIATLVGRAKATIVYRRESLALKVFDEKTGTDIIDDIIRLL